MKRVALIFIVVMTVLFAGLGQAAAEPTVVLDGQQLAFSVAPFEQDGRILVQMRPIFEALGADIVWDDPSQTVTATQGASELILTIGETTAYLNGSAITMDVPACLMGEGYTVVPLRFVSEALGADVNYDENTETVTINTSYKIQPAEPISVDAGQTKVHFIDVGQADAIYIQMPDNNDILIDGGNRDDGQTVVNYLTAQGCDDIELVVGTHPHEDHIGALPAVMQAFDVEEVIDSGKSADTATYDDYQAAIQAEGCAYEADANQDFTYGDDIFTILTGDQAWSETNDYSVVSKLQCGGITFLFAGDAGIDVEANLGTAIQADILKVSHHGSNTGTNEEILNLIKPSVAIISVGTGNTYGHPKAEVIGMLESIGAQIYRTDLNGNIVVSTDGSTYSVTTGKEAVQSSSVNDSSSSPMPPAEVDSSSDNGSQVSPTVESNAGSTVYVTATGEKYHMAGCRYLKNACIQMSLADAIAEGYTPCSVCGAL